MCLVKCGYSKSNGDHPRLGPSRPIPRVPQSADEEVFELRSRDSAELAQELQGHVLEARWWGKENLLTDSDLPDGLEFVDAWVLLDYLIRFGCA